MNFNSPPLPKQIAAPLQVKRIAKRLISSNRLAIAGALLLGIIIPELFHTHASSTFHWAVAAHQSDPMFYAAMAALLLAHLILRHASQLPFVNTKIIVLPVFVSSFAAVAIAVDALFQARGYYHLPLAFFAGLAWYTMLAVALERLGNSTIAMIGVSELDPNLSSRFNFIPWSSTQIPHKADAIVYDSWQDYPPKWERFFARAVLRNIPVYDLDHFREMILGRVSLREKPELVFGHLLPSLPYLRIKRIIDLTLAVLILPIALIIIGLAAILIRIGSPGPIFFLQSRVGYQGRLFTCYKLRTMRTDLAGPLYTLDHDPRITRIGAFLRKSRIDELPQIFNVILGDMSWIGPRPEALRLSRSYEKSISYYRYRHSVRPGISGWAAVHQGNVALNDAASLKLEYDFYYIKYFSVWLDYVIAMMTIRTVFTGFGSK